MYDTLTFPKLADRPSVYTNHVTTIDGKIQVLENTREYWPIGSSFDYQTFTKLRMYADCILHGPNTAIWTRAVDNLGKLDRKFYYVVISNHPREELAEFLNDAPKNVTPLLITNETAPIPQPLNGLQIHKIGTTSVPLDDALRYLKSLGISTIDVEAGATLTQSLIRERLVDEMFVTIAPKLFGNKPGKTLTMLEGSLFRPEEVVTAELLSSNVVKNELYLRYRLHYP